jgi:hypothetical protein
MTKEEAKKAAEVMSAYVDGREIECKVGHSHDSWDLVNDPAFNWYYYDYRIRPKQKLVPFTFDDANSIIGRAIKKNYFNWKSIIVDCAPNGVYAGINSNFVSYENLLKVYEFLDGSPCGKIAND